MTLLQRLCNDVVVRFAAPVQTAFDWTRDSVTSGRRDAPLRDPGSACKPNFSNPHASRAGGSLLSPRSVDLFDDVVTAPLQRRGGAVSFLAERGGFEPPKGC